MPTIFALLLILADQAGKYSVRHGGGFYICNPNIAFGIKINPSLFYALWVCTILFILISTNYKFKAPNSNTLNPKRFWILDFGNFNLFRIWNLGFGIFKIQHIGLLLILSGALSNILDRLYFGCVIDFIKLPYWPVFNPADAFIVIGVIISVVSICKNKN